MKKFSFSLQTVLNVRMIAEDLAKQELAKTLQQLEDEKKKLVVLREEWEAVCALPFRDTFNVMHQQYYRDSVMNSIEVQNQAVIQKQEVVNQVRKKALHAERERKVLEKLKDGQVKEYQKQVSAEEQRFIDEVAVLRFARNGINK
ncbi:flagellar export protein FliJ [Candidatus Formimonas warabiya]|uniref:Flagellar FliJ protein n=1 Tax=Formimonas warabiya TaxID=1761012 RepID=A0A3G1KT13_FORW1|nr:flagellar export protein FliJ [Candidatus Formimonas warabiya]ATW25663.1 flagellar export protein FliJ [Candidatus Formimonas warabiya]